MTKQSILKEEVDEEYKPTREGKYGSKKKKQNLNLNQIINSSKWTPK